jgi:CHASE2 domain-containing sensor protein
MPSAVPRQKHARKLSLINGLGIVFVVTVISALLNAAGFYEPFVLKDLDRLVQSSKPSTWSDDIVLVAIDNADYLDRAMFGGVSPLEPAKVVKILEAIHNNTPDVMGVDLITSDSSSDDSSNHMAPNKWREQPQNLLLRPRLIWAVVGSAAPETTKEKKDEIPRIKAGFPLGLPSIPTGSLGVPLHTPDSDGTVRQLYKEAAVEFPRGRFERIPTMAAALADTRIPISSYRSNPSAGTLQRIVFTGKGHRFKRFRASLVTGKLDVKAPPPNLRSQLEGKIVILGGTFEAARDTYVTPLGAMDGLELLAHSAQTLLRDKVRDFSELEGVFLEMMLGAAVFAAVYKLPSPWYQVAAIFVPIIVAFGVGYYAFNYLGSFIATAGSLAGIPLAFAAEHWRDLQELKQENQTLRKHNEKLERESRATPSISSVEVNNINVEIREGDA